MEATIIWDPEDDLDGNVEHSGNTTSRLRKQRKSCSILEAAGR
jgi:hypothetical protein